MSNVLEEAIVFATRAHDGQVRKLSKIPYILHPLEVAAIISTITDDLETMAAGVLHDTIEDCGVDPREIKEKFGPRVSALVQSETEDRLSNRPEAETWQERKEESILMLSNSKDIDVKILWLGDKLSNMRSFYREYLKKGDDVWLALHQKDKRKQEWYYRTIALHLQKDLGHTAAYEEYIGLVDKVFKGDNS
ncbi:MAG: bifunctional (p)ppGpp synthetase/guanosine-3',5'-bis(diphosphate) 3'-pyrophosphohydrolase [Oscillospiraceae bacterium]|nr:bifunctional (p)ppGpp synthetase/guanosine-3',5'-bis(diphosphate) 3'-pyrophosphohydrolase [Candidatus Equicaccousia limihippi]